ncbi:MAG: bifunctional 23S rRNA (guanine(2069)-N(7))-methyltransferase RlmK/23S rRNA (guanine(2445)-N(2))-methyltransferase RlmL [Gammaproteobacteria bacterium]|nr:bifunctional 23S rRNA (guanine(2069)-N(7))-methyltransferase RlmK/23S rRNA (guanine(2445)-N(2))-methyltransferase RlmL [Gammaproteobacteria bacterium]
MPAFIATCAKHLEYLLKDELISLGVKNAKEGLSLVNFDAEWPDVYRILMWSRIASRVLFPVAEFVAKDDTVLYQQVSKIDWSMHIKAGDSFLVNAQTFKSSLSNSKYISQKVKDAVVDHFVDNDEKRPDVEFEQPSVVLHCRVKRDKVTLSIDLAGQGLHNRNYRIIGGKAPIKENLAAALLIRAGWNKTSEVLYDPMCGSGTFLVEAAMISFDIAPGLIREYLGISGWLQFNQKLWQQVVTEAEQRKEAGMNSTSVRILGSDVNPKAVRNAQANIALADLEDHIKVSINGIDQIPQMEFPSKGLIIVNPPYSERLGEVDEVKALYKELGNILKTQFMGWQASILSADKQFGHALGIRAKKIYQFNNGSIACELLNLDLETDNFIERKSNDEIATNFEEKLSPQAIQLKNRIEKNRSRLKRFLQKNEISCYRVYDADLPEYNAAIDVYEDHLHIQEYKPPKSIDEQIALKRLKDIQRVAAGVFQIPFSQVFVKVRQQQKGQWQYSRSDQSDKEQHDKARELVVLESGRKFYINLVDYLDTGLFLDHRKTRQLVADKSCGKSLLNLFCYTASASVYAATQGAKSTCNVDLSNNYLDWAKQNFELNRLDQSSHEFVRDDCIKWLDEAIENKRKFDVIFLDPPTFSNSKKMESDFDVQSDHVELIEKCLQLLPSKGELIFSNNFQKFEILVQSDEKKIVKEITRQTQSEDFSRKNLHRSWLITKV